MSIKSGIRITIIIISMCVVVALSVFTIGCRKGEITVTFKADGEADIVITAEYGGSVTPPEVPEKIGNYGYWDVEDLNKITSDLTVNAVYETEGLQYSPNATGCGVAKGDMDANTTELYIPTEYQGIPVTQIMDNGFYKCWELTSVSLPKGLISIGNKAFSYCDFTSITLPDSVTDIGFRAFHGCMYLESINFPYGLVEIGEEAFMNSGLKMIKLPDSITSINDMAFCCTNPETVILPQSVTSIGEKSFFGCIHLKSMMLPDGITEIGEGAFGFCAELEYINLPLGLTSLSRSLLSGCCSIKSITIPESVTSIDYRPFYHWKEDQTIYVKGYTERPKGWYTYWNDDATVVWGC